MPQRVPDNQYVVVMLDVLGFKVKMRSDTAPETFRAFVEEVVGAKQVFDCETECAPVQALVRETNERVHLWSDTLVFLKGPLTPADGRALSSAAAFATNCITSGLPQGLLMRGAIAVGSVFQDQTVHAVAGPAIVECAEHYEALDWVGCHLCPSAERFLAEMNDGDRNRTNTWLNRGKVPWKGKTGLTIAGTAMHVAWLDAAVREITGNPRAQEDTYLSTRLAKCRADPVCLDAVAREYYRDLLDAYAEKNPQSDVRTKVQNTLEFMGPRKQGSLRLYTK